MLLIKIIIIILISVSLIYDRFVNIFEHNQNTCGFNISSFSNFSRVGGFKINLKCISFNKLQDSLLNIDLKITSIMLL